MRAWAALLASVVVVGVADPVYAGHDGTPERIIVQWIPGIPADTRTEVLSQAGLSDAEGLGGGRFQVLEVQGSAPVAALRTLRDDPAVALAVRDGWSALHAPAPDDPLFASLWGLHNTGQAVRSAFFPIVGADLNVLSAWDKTVGDDAVLVADLDTGYRRLHPDLAAATWSNSADPDDGTDNDGNGIVDDSHGVDYAGSNVDAPTTDGDPTDAILGGGHGVHTAGTIAATGNNGTGTTGVAQRATVMPVRVCGWSASEQQIRCPVSSQIAGINYAGRRGARVVNMSFGGTVGNVALRNAMALYPGTLFVISAGNDHADTQVPGQTTYPCSYDPRDSGSPVDNVVCVTATDQGDRLATFANWGAQNVDLAAPGTEILSTHTYRTRLDEMFDAAGFPYPGWVAGSWIRTNPTIFVAARITNNTATQANATTRTVQTPVMTTPWPGPCRVRQDRTLSLGGSDTFSYTVYIDGVPGPSFAPTSSGSNTANFTVSGAGSHSLQVRFSYTRSGGSTANGVWLDDIAVQCMTPVGAEGPEDYAYSEGTSMAAPHVSGAAVLLASYEPNADVAQLRSALLSGIDPIADLNPSTGGHPVATGGRLDVDRALSKLDALVVPDTTVAVDALGSAATARFRTVATRAPASYECSIDAAPFRPCVSPLSIAGLRKGAHSVAVRAIDGFGNSDSTPAAASWLAKSPPKVKAVRVKRKAHKAVFTWRAVPAATRYLIRSTKKGPGYGRWVPLTSPRATIRGLSPVKRYRVQIVAANAAGRSTMRTVRVRRLH